MCGVQPHEHKLPLICSLLDHLRKGEMSALRNLHNLKKFGLPLSFCSRYISVLHFVNNLQYQLLVSWYVFNSCNRSKVLQFSGRQILLVRSCHKVSQYRSHSQEWGLGVWGWNGNHAITPRGNQRVWGHSQGGKNHGRKEKELLLWFSFGLFVWVFFP